MQMRYIARTLTALLAFASVPAGIHAQASQIRSRGVLAESQKKDDINAGTIGLAAGQLEGAPIRLAAEIARAVDDGDRLHVLPIVTRGPSENVESLLYLRGVDAAVISMDTLDTFKSRMPNALSRISYVLNLFPSEAHILVRGDIASIDDLKGKKVNFNTQGTAAAYSGPLIFDRLGVQIEKTFIPHPAALEQMKTGDIAAVFFITSKPVDAFLKGRFPAGFKFLPVPYDERLSDYYMPAVLNHDDYPSLIAEGAQVDTIAVATALVAFNWQPRSERYQRMARFVNSLFQNIGKLQGPGFDPKWRSINLAAKVPALERFGPAQDWLDRADRYRQTASVVTEVGIDPELARQQIARKTRLGESDQERLLDQFLRWARSRR